MDDSDFFQVLLNDDEFTVEQAAIFMAMTTTRDKEDEMKALLAKHGFIAIATTVSGDDSIVRKKVIGSVVGACLNANLIQKTKKHVHSVVHATHEACMSGKLGSTVNQNYQLKVAIVRKQDWLSVCLYGDMAIHEYSNHKTIGLGVNHV